MRDERAKLKVGESIVRKSGVRDKHDGEGEGEGWWSGTRD